MISLSKKLENKKMLRRYFLERRGSLAEDYRSNADKAVCDRLISLEFIRSKGVVAAYMSDGTEPDLGVFLEHCLAEKIKIFLPRFDFSGETGGYEMVEITNLKSQLKEGKYGLLEPLAELKAVKEESLLDINWLVPGVAFDDAGGRLGRGKGVYDRLLSGKGHKVGIFYDCQKYEAVPMEGHDRKLDMIVTESKVYRFGKME